MGASGRRLIYDVGMHRGEDTAFYLRRGFDVVGVEANPDLVQVLRAQFQSEIRAGRLVIIDKAVNVRSGPAKFMKFKQSVWGTLSDAFAERNTTVYGSAMQEIEVECIVFADILRQHGVPYYAKIDIEGCDLLCLEALREFPERPRYVSIESSVTSAGTGFSDVLRELKILRSLGYQRFRYVDQGGMEGRCDYLTGEGEPIRYTFPGDSSGPFGKDLAQEWHRFPHAAAVGLLLRARADATSLNGRLFGRRTLRRLQPSLHRLGAHLRRRGHWYDLHAAMRTD